MKDDPAQYALDFGRDRIAFVLSFGEHNRFQITVHPDMRVEVQAPAGKALDVILARVQKRAPWINKQLRYFEQFQPRPTKKQFVSGEALRYLGRQYRLKVLPGTEQSVHLTRPFLVVHLPDTKDRGAIQALVSAWYQERARATFLRRMELLQIQAKRHLPCLPSLRVRRMTRRWGSCNGRDCILLNTALVQAPLRCVDYVILHELCHLRHNSHSPRFFKLLQRLMPDWKEHKDRLERSTGDMSNLT